MSFFKVFLTAVIFVAAAAAHPLGRASNSTPDSPTRPGTISTCSMYHTAKAGDTCIGVEAEYQITPAQFLSWNPTVDSKCTHTFWEAYSYCVGTPDMMPAPSGSSPSGSLSDSGSALTVVSVSLPGTDSSTTSSITRVTVTSIMLTTTVTSKTLYDPTLTSTDGSIAPTQSGVISSCNNYYTVEEGEDCSIVELKFGISHAMFLNWNKAVSESCRTGFWAGYRYCVDGTSPSGPTRALDSSSTSVSTPTSGVTDVSAPGGTTFITTSRLVPSGSLATSSRIGPNSGTPACKYIMAVAGDTCETIESTYKLSHDSFLSWNPTVSKDCRTGFWAGYPYCIDGPSGSDSAVPSGTDMSPSSSTAGPSSSNFAPTTTTSPPSTSGTSSTSSSDAPQMSGADEACNLWHVAKPNETCDNVAAQYNLSRSSFLVWNKAVDEFCSKNFWAGYKYCVGVGPAISSSSTASSVSSTLSTVVSAPPTGKTTL